MKNLYNCKLYHTGISAPHTIEIEGRLTSIENGDTMRYYIRNGFTPYAIATGTDGNIYAIYAKNFPDRVIAFK